MSNFTVAFARGKNKCDNHKWSREVICASTYVRLVNQSACSLYMCMYLLLSAQMP